LPLVDFLSADEINGRGGVLDFEGLGVGGDDDVFGNALDFEAKIERASFGGGQIENEVAGNEGWMLEMNVVAAWRKDEEIGAVRGGSSWPDVRGCTVIELRGDFDIANAVTGKIAQFSGKAGIGCIALRQQGKTN